MFRASAIMRARRLLCTAAKTIAIDTSNLPRRAPVPPSAAEKAEGLLKVLATQLRVKGPMSVKEFMTTALTHPTHGYYMRSSRDVFGRAGDFVTSPEVSQVFGELLGVWCVACWERLGRPAQLRLIEAGPGRGTLIADVLRSTAVFPAFHAALSVDLVEVRAV